MKIRVNKGQSFRYLLIRIDACTEAREWVGRKSLRCAYRQCQRGDWLLWLAWRVGVDRRVLVLAACECARLSLQYVRPGEERPRVAIETAERWARGEAGVTLNDVRRAANAANAAAYAAANAANAAAAHAAAAAYAAYDAAYAAYAAAVRASTLQQCAEIARRHISLQMLEQAMRVNKEQSK